MNADSIVTVFQRNLELSPQKFAFKHIQDATLQEKAYSYQKFDSYAKKIAVKLNDRQLKGETVLLLFENSIDFIAALFACFYVGAIAVPFNKPHFKRPDRRLQSILESVKPHIVLTTSQIIEEVYENEESVSGDLLAVEMIATDLSDENVDDFKINRPKPDDIAYLQFTSGSTLKPRGVAVTHQNIMTATEIARDCTQSNAEKNIVTWLPFFHDFGLVGHVLHSIYIGATLIFFSPKLFISQPSIWLEVMTKFHGNISGAPNFAYRLCCDEISDEQVKTFDLKDWESALCGAEPMQFPVVNGFISKFSRANFHENAFLPGYGLAEATLIVSAKPYLTKYNYHNLDKAKLKNRIVKLTEDKSTSKKVLSCGTVSWGGQTVLIVDENTKRPLSNFQIGEIWVSGPHVASGYWKEAALTKEVFKAFTSDNRGPFLRTGDLGYLTDAGELFVTGRLKDLIIIDGVNYYPQDIEYFVESHSPIFRKNSAAAFVANKGKLVVCAEVNTHLFSKENSRNLFQMIKGEMFKEFGLYLDELIFLKPKAIPKTSSGKVSRSTTKTLYANQQINRVV